MLDLCASCLAKNRLVIVSVGMLFICYYIYATVLRIKNERDLLKQDYDASDNFTNYFLAEEDRQMDIQQYIENIGKIMTLRKRINKLNKNPKVKIKPEMMKKVTVVIVVQVSNRPVYFLEFLKSLQKVMGIMNVVLILSHDFYEEEINNLVSTVQFVTVIQIFYPFSTQLYPNVFPGDDSQYCSEGWICKNDIDEKRNSLLAQIKHHWWWKINYVFDQMKIMKDYNGLVVFLEEDQYVTEDFLYVLKILDTARKNSCHRCDLLSVGAYPPILSKYNINSTLYVEEFGATPYSMGIAFNRTTWNRIRKLRRHFCYFDDYDWASSLRFLSSRFPEGRLNMLSIAGARVIHFGICSALGQNTDCDVDDKLNKLQEFLELAKSGFFPKDFVTITNKRYTKVRKSGNFSDDRDHELCMYFSKENH